MDAKPVIYFDGICNLCTGSVQFLLKHDHRNRFRFASLQGEAGQKMLRENHLPMDQYKTFIVEDGGKIYTRSTAALRVLKLLGGGWSLLYAFMIIPVFIRDAIYHHVSKNRYRWFGKKQTCWLPDTKWNDRFLP